MASKRKVILKGAALSSDDDDSEIGSDCSTDDGEVQFKIPIAARRKPSTRKPSTRKAPAAAAASESIAPAPTLPVAPAPAKVEACLGLMHKAQDGQDVACHALLWMLNDCAAAEPTAARAVTLREMLLPALQRVEKTAGLLRRICGGTAAGIATSSSSSSGGSATSSGGKKKKKGSPLEQAADALDQRLAKLLPAEVAAAPPDASEAAGMAAQPLAPAASKLNSKRGNNSSSKGSKGGVGSSGAGSKAAPALGGLVGALQAAKGKLRKTGGKSKKRAAPNDDGSMKNELLKSLALRRAAIKATCDDDELQSPCQSPGAFGTPSKKARQEN